MRFVFISIVLLIMTACATKDTEYIVTTEYKYVTYQLPVKFTSDCKASKPMGVDDYSKLTLLERENYLSNYAITLLGDLKRCDSKLKGVMRYVDEVNKMAESTPTTSKDVIKKDRIKGKEGVSVPTQGGK